MNRRRSNEIQAKKSAAFERALLSRTKQKHAFILAREAAILKARKEERISLAAEFSVILSEVSGFSSEMALAMLKGCVDGKTGWQDPDSPFWRGDFEQEILRRIREKLDRRAVNEEFDVANYAFMLYTLRRVVKDRAVAAEIASARARALSRARRSR